MIRYLWGMGIAVLFLVLLGFAFRNQDEVSMRFYLGAEWRAPLILMLLICVIIGAVIGILGSLSYVLRQRRELIMLRRRARDKEADEDMPRSV
jgi:uncharacterized integral membrane protein